VSQSIVSSDRDFDEDLSEDSEVMTKRDQVEMEATQVRRKPKQPFFMDPMIYGSFNNWQPQPLIRVSHLARALDKRPTPDFIA